MQSAQTQRKQKQASDPYKPHAIACSLCGEDVPRVLPISLVWSQDWAWEILMVDAIRPELRLKAQARELVPLRALAVPCVRVFWESNEVASVDLDAGLIGPDLHRDAIRRLDPRGEQLTSL
mmetsp:Transcript_8400/g.18239  ORF Transcript_8400/g.18239 Transcript_8400/m.18239 type:complete len:121 (-) Transcript_8400:832-1194(-)